MALLAFSPSIAGGAIKGTVFVDLNGNGVCDPGEPGVAGAKVSDGKQIVLTDSEGRYVLEPSPGSVHIFVCVPSGFKPLPSFRGAKVRFWRLLSEIRNGKCNFPLQRDEEQERFCFLHVSDSHGFWTFSPSEVVDWALEGILSLVPEGVPVKFIAATGDDPCDCPTATRLRLERSVLVKREIPWLQVPGNHEFLYAEKCYDSEWVVREFGEGAEDWSPREGLEHNFGPTYCGVEATLLSAGGIAGAEGSVRLLIEGEKEAVQKALGLVRSLQGEPMFTEPAI